MISRVNNQPQPTRDIDAMVCWMVDEPLREGGRYAIKQTTRTCRTVVDEVRYKVDVNTLHRDEDATSLELNEIGRVHLRTSQPLLVDQYRDNRATGSFIIVDEATNFTVGAGMVLNTEI
jgi:bifunctional enzyme CysN/CysC